ncbi:hypothetical protein [Gordonia amicalis]|uniref:hypothetical protein n=1 Tax=Gordonia amicalis TaxID=89053 RepID=UPI0005878068|nr:hypothetical protein [Gordonia amicalis]NKX79430.1 hypothetical protein [Gordonia amicalis]
MPESSLRDRLVVDLKVVRRRGLHRLVDYIDDVPALREVAVQTTGADNAEHVENLLRSVYKMRSEGAQGTAIGILLGLEQGRRGANPTVLREAAATRLGYHSVDTFRKQPEANALLTFASLIETYSLEYQNSSQPEDYKINIALNAIKELTLTEYAELIRRLQAWFKENGRGFYDT